MREMSPLGINAAKDLERHRRADKFRKPVREHLHLVPLSFARAACRLSDEEEQERRDRQCHEKEQGGERVCNQCHNENERDDYSTRNHCGQNRMKKWIESVHTLKGER